MISVDTSIVVAAFASWHERHRSAAAVLTRKPRVPAHVLLETYSVLTRLPPPHRAGAALVAAFLADRFREAPLTLSSRAHMDLVARAAAEGIAGGSIYDALIAATVLQAKARLLTRDQRAAAVYERIGVDFEMVD